MINFEKEICDYLSLPAIPLKEWNGKESFKDGVAVVELSLGELAYAVCTFDAQKDKEPRIKKVFTQIPFTHVASILVVPSYMDTKDIDDADLDEQSKEAAQRIVDEANELTNDDYDKITLPDNEYFFDNIHNDDEAIAFITSYNKENGIKGAIPSKHDTIVLRLGVIYSDLNKKNKK